MEQSMEEQRHSRGVKHGIPHRYILYMLYFSFHDYFLFALRLLYVPSVFSYSDPRMLYVGF